MTNQATSRGYGISSLVDHEIVAALAPAAEAAGYDTFWVNDLPQASGLASLGVAGREATEIALGVGVLAVDRWSGDQIRREIERAAIDPARLTVGIGAGQLTIGALRALIDVASALRGFGARRVVIGSLGPVTTRAGGSDADGVLLNWVTPAAAGTLANVAREGGTSRHTRPWVAAYTRVACDADAEDGLTAECSAYAGYPAYARHFARFGITGRETTVLGDEPTIKTWLEEFDGVVDHLVVRAIATNETAKAYLDVLNAAAPGSRGWGIA